MNIIKSIKNYRRFAKTVAELQSFSDRELADMGIARANIRSIVRDAM
jgi:uncharacterized protein YjiS (DUF1127 family)